MYKVRCKLIKFEGDIKTFPAISAMRSVMKFITTERILPVNCPHLITNEPVVYGIHLLGHNFSENIAFVIAD
jgi:hypothetical protein